MKCIINGDLFTFDQNQSIQEVLHSLELDPKRVIVELNKELIKQDKYEEYTVRRRQIRITRNCWRRLICLK